MKARNCQRVNAHGRRLSGLLFGCAFAVYVLFAQGTVRSWDGGTMMAVTESIVERGDFSVPAGSPGKQGRDGKWYGWYGIGCSLLAIPAYLAGKYAADLLAPSQRRCLTEFAISWINPLLTALTATLLFRLAMAAGVGLGGSVLAWGAYCFGSSAFPLMRGFYSEPATALFLLLSMWYALNPYRCRPAAASMWAGAALGAAMLCRAVCLLAAPVIGGLIFYRQWRDSGTRAAAAHVLLAAVPVAMSAAVIGWYNWVRFGSFLDTGYYPNLFSSSLLKGLYIQLFSPQRGILLFMPFLVFAPVGAVRHWRKDPLLVSGAVGLFVVYLLAYSKFQNPIGGHTAGPRFLAIVLPGLVILVGAAWRHLRRPGRYILVGLVAAAVLIHLPLAYINVGYFYANEAARAATAGPGAGSVEPGLLGAGWRYAFEVTKNVLFHADRISSLPEQVHSHDPVQLLSARYFHTPYVWWVLAYFHGISAGVIWGIVSILLGVNIVLWQALVKALRQVRTQVSPL